MTVDTLDSPLQLPAPDMDVLRDNGSQLARQAIALDVIYLPVLRDALKGLLGELSACDEQALSLLTSLPVALDTDALGYLLESLARSRNQPVEGNIDVIDQVSRELKNSARSSLAKVIDERARLDKSLSNLVAIRLKVADGLIPELEEELAPLKERLAKESAPMAELIEKEASLNTLIDILEAVSVLDKLRPLVETLQKLIEIDPKDPLVGVIKLGIEGVKHILGMPGDAIKYNHLIEERGKLQAQLDGIRPTVRILEERLAEASQKITQLQALKALDALRDAYLQEARKLVEALQVFIKQSRIDEGADLVDEMTRFIGNCTMLTAWLDDLRRRWQASSMLAMDS